MSAGGHDGSPDSKLVQSPDSASRDTLPGHSRGVGSTQTVHAGVPAERPHHTLAPSIAQTATYKFQNTADLVQYMRGEDADSGREEYGRYGNPTVHELEQRMAALEGTADCVAFSSGMAAVTTLLLGLTKAGDHVVLFRDCYRRTRQFVTQMLSRFGVEHSLVEPGDLEGLDRAITKQTKVVVSESPTNPYNFCVDFGEMVAICKRHGRVRTVVDATFATPYNCRPAEFGVDLVLHSATKYLGGHNDVMGGVVSGPGHLVSLLRETRGVLGGILDPHAAFLILRGLRTLGIRMQRQNHTALAVAQALEAHPKIERVFYAGLESHPSHAIARRQMRGSGGIVSFVVKGGQDAASRLIDGCQLATIASSLGGVETLIEQPRYMSFFELDEAGLQSVGIDPALVRLAVGVEETDDVIGDLLQALDRV
ncbi:MAG: aminotransferase class I/II-fold pyridoxal phosphate-dependent enzyme [Myxococcales bacterium]|nr:aminotransferase class I/II-fold pyridoxal phosphate-dependent enzyme [Myxococcales bacterium]